MKFGIKIIFFFLMLGAVFFFYPVLEEAWVFFQIKFLKISPTSFVNKGQGPFRVAQKMLNAENPEEKKKGLELSVALANPKLLPEVLPFLKSENSLLSELALKALSAMVSIEMKEPLMNIVKTADARTRLGILQVLSQALGNKTDRSQLFVPFKKDHFWVIRMALCDELGLHPGKDAGTILKELLSDEELDVAQSASLALANIGFENEFSDIFTHLSSPKNWIDQWRAIRLISLFPEKLVTLLVARYITSSNDFLAMAALDWMMEKGDERDFALIIRETEAIPFDNSTRVVLKAEALKAIAILAPMAKRRDQVLLMLMKCLKMEREEIQAAALEGIRILKGNLAEQEVLAFLDNTNLELAAQAILTLGSFANEKHLDTLLKLLQSEHARLRIAAYRALLDYAEIPSSKIPLKTHPCESVEEAENMGLFLLVQATDAKAKPLLFQEYKNAASKHIRLKLLEYGALLDDRVSFLDLALSKSDLIHFEKAKNIMDRSSLKLGVSAMIGGFLYYRERQSKDTAFSLFSYTSASESWWEHKDILYLKGKEGEGGKLQGVILHEDYNSYYFSNASDEVIQMEKPLVDGIHESPLLALGHLKRELPQWTQYFENALDHKKWDLAGFLLQKIWVRIDILKTEIAYHSVAKKAILEIGKFWEIRRADFEAKLQKLGMIRLSDRYVSLKKIKTTEMEALSPEEAESKKKQADAKYREGLEYSAKNDLQKAIQSFKEALNLWAFHADSLKQIGTAYAQLGEYDEAIKFYLELEFPNDVNVLNSLSLVYRLKGYFEKALRVLIQEIEIDPTKERGYLDAAEVFTQMKKDNEAEDLLEKSLNVVKNSYTIHFQLAKVYAKRKAIDLALPHIQHCLKEKPEDSEAWTYLGYLYFVSGKAENAISALNKAIAFDLSSVNARLTLADVYISLGRKKDAEVELRRVLAIDPANQEASELLQTLEK